MKISVLSNDDILRLSVGEVKNSKDHSLRSKILRPVRDGLYDYNIFGTKNTCLCGYTSGEYKKCPSCGVLVKPAEMYENQIAHINLACPVIPKQFLGLLNQQLSKIGINFKNVISIFNTEFVLEETDDEKFTLMTESGDKKYKLFIKEFDENSNQNSIGTYGLLALSDFKNAKGQSLSKIRKYIYTVCPVSSPEYRQYTLFTMPGQSTIKIRYPEIHVKYRLLMYINDFIKNSFTQKIPLVDKITYMYILSNAMDHFISAASLFKQSKISLIRQSIRETRKPNSMRWNAVSNTDLSIDYVLLPKDGVYYALQNKIVDGLLKVDGVFDALKEYEEQTENAMKVFDYIVNKTVVLVNRNPTLHKNSVLAFKIKLWDKTAIGINPVIGKGFNLDYDGDQLAVYFITEDDQIKLLGDSMFAKNQWFFNKDFSLTVNPSVVTCYGLNHAFKVGNIKNVKFKSLKDCEDAFKSGKIEFDDLVSINGKSTTYSKEKLNEIYGKDLESEMGIKELNASSLSQLIAKLASNPNRSEILTKLISFGNEIATIQGITIMPLKDLYSGISSEVDELINSNISTEEKYAKLMKKFPEFVKTELQKLPNSNIDSLMSAARIDADTISSIYLPKITLKDGNLKVNQSSQLSGVTEKDFVDSMLISREVLSIKQTQTPVNGYNERQVFIASMKYKYVKKDADNSSYIFVPKELAEDRDIISDVEDKTNSGFVAINSLIFNKEDLIYQNQISKRLKNQYVEGACLGADLMKSLNEGKTQGALKLKYGANLEFINNESLLCYEDGIVHFDKDKLFIGSYEYPITNRESLSSKITEGAKVKKGDVVMYNWKRKLLKDSAIEFSAFIGSKIIDNKKVTTGISYAPISGVVDYTDKNLLINGKVICELDKDEVYFYPKGAKVKIGDRLSNALLNPSQLINSGLIDIHYIPYLYYLELKRLTMKNLNLQLAEMSFRLMLKDSKVYGSIIQSDDFITRMYYGETKTGMKSFIKNMKEDSIQLNEDNPLFNLLFRIG